MDPNAARVRHVSPLLATAIVAMPVLFIWLLLRKGYANSTRRAAFFYLGMNVVPGLIGLLLGG